jgi:hypothetical protein
MMSKETKINDERNTGFGFPENLVRHKPGFETAAQKQEPETGGNHRFRPSEPKKIPQGSLAERIAKSAKGEK